jgi:hypothetical protein
LDSNDLLNFKLQTGPVDGESAGSGIRKNMGFVRRRGLEKVDEGTQVI